MRSVSHARKTASPRISQITRASRASPVQFVLSKMAEVKANGAPGIDHVELRRDVLSSSTKRRIAKLRHVEQLFHDNGECAQAG